MIRMEKHTITSDCYQSGKQGAKNKKVKSRKWEQGGDREGNNRR